MADLGLNIPSLVVFLVNFTILLAILYLFAFKPILKLLDQRSERIRESLEAADTARQAATASEAKTQEQLNEARLEGQRLLEQARQIAEKFREDEMTKTRHEAEAFIERARQGIEQEKSEAIEEVKTHFAGLAIYAAERVIERSLDRESHKDLIGKVLSQESNVDKES
jgi:F-type H+-transporting ATPase subunit b